MKITHSKRIILEPDDNCLLTDGEIYSTKVFLSPYADPSDWHDIKLEEVPRNELSEENSPVDIGLV